MVPWTKPIRFPGARLHSAPPARAYFSRAYPGAAPVGTARGPFPGPTRIPCATPDLHLKYLDATLATYVQRHMKHFKHALETLAKKHLKTIANIRHMQIEPLQHMYEIYATSK
jgi:hypothetical protein